MSTIVVDRLYNLLPAVYRLRDSAQGEPLHALLTLIEQQYDAIDQDITGLYENWFIETCAEWVVPYIGDLLGVRPLSAVSAGTFSARAYVAHTLDYRRRKGTAAMVEELALDVTGWPARVVEYFEPLATTQYLNHLRPNNIVTADLRPTNELELLGGPFEKFAHTVDVRHIGTMHGRYNIPNLGIFLWKLEDYLIGPISTDTTAAMRQGDARAVATSADGRYTFDPLGLGSPLCNRPQTIAATGTLATEINVPGLLRRLPLYRELEALRQAEVDGVEAPVPVYFGANPVFALRAGNQLIPFDQVQICDIEDVSATDWRRPPASKPYVPSQGGSFVNKPIAVSVDPVRGRIAFPAGQTPASLEVSYVFNFSGDVGAGPFDRTASLTDPTNGPPPFNAPTRWQVAVAKDLPPLPNQLYSTLAGAVEAWNAQPAGTTGVIAILDSHTYAEDLTANPIVIGAGSQLLIVAADWPAARQPGNPANQILEPIGLRPHLHGSITAIGNAPASSEHCGGLFIDGLLIEGTLTIANGNLGMLGLSHSTIAPAGTLAVSSSGAAGTDNASLTVNLYRTICGPVSIPACIATLNSVDSIINGIAAANCTLGLQTTSVLGSTNCRIANLSNSIFTQTVTVQQRQEGCVRFCSVPTGSQTGRRYYCQPDLALNGVNSPAARAAVRARLTPQFTSLAFAQPGFAQLSARGAPEIATGADNGAEMGAFGFLLQPQRRANLLTALDEYLRFGIEAGTIEET